MRHGISLFLVTLAALAACGGEDAGGSGDTATDQMDADSRAFGAANSFALRATGAKDTTLQIDGSELSLAGGCNGSSPISLAFVRGNPSQPEFFEFGFDTGEVVATGATGSFAVEELHWDDGYRTETLSGGATVDIPNRWSGAGSLTLGTHTATMSERRMVGTVTGEVRGEEADGAAEITVEFDVNMSCGVG